MTKTRETMIAELGRRHPAAADDVDAILAMPRSDAVNEGLLADFPDAETELAFLEFLNVAWIGWQQHVDSPRWNGLREAFLAGRAALSASSGSGK